MKSDEDAKYTLVKFKSRVQAVVEKQTLASCGCTILFLIYSSVCSYVWLCDEEGNVYSISWLTRLDLLSAVIGLA